MSNPFEKAGQGISARIREVEDAKRAKLAAEAAERETKKKSFEEALRLFKKLERSLNRYVGLANDALHPSGAIVAIKVDPMQERFAGTFTIALQHFNKTQSQFRVVANSSHKIHIHELKDPSYGPFDLADIDALPFEEMFKQFLETSIDKIGIEKP